MIAFLISFAMMIFGFRRMMKDFFLMAEEAQKPARRRPSGRAAGGHRRGNRVPPSFRL